MRRAAHGYSYLELMLVVAMASVLTALVLPTARTVHRAAREKELARALTRIRTAIDLYHRDWERGCIESEDEGGWPENLEELTEGVEWSDAPECMPKAEQPATGATPPGDRSRRRLDRKKEPEKKVYLRRVPRDPFNREGDEWDTMGWKARSYDDEPDSHTWGDKGLYDVYSASDLTALDGTKYAEW